jgi:outer membrane receptor protein involved in Fe transport
VRVRQSGGLGSASLVSIHGLSGRQVRTFIDGLPQDFMGTAGVMASLPIGGLDRIEVYKGVVPVELGGDALGGALNFVTASEPGQRQITLGIGSHGARRAEFGVRTREGRWSGSLTAAHAASRNDYRVDATQLNEHGQPQPVRARRFHDEFRIGRVTGELSRRYSDAGSIRVRAFGASQYDEIQHAAVMAQPYGQASMRERTVGGVAGWEHTSGRLHLAAELGRSHSRSRFVDTTLNVYSWHGDVIRRRDYGGEISSSRNLLVLNTDNVLARAHAAVSAGPGVVRLHVLHMGFERTGHDSVAAEYYGSDPFRHPAGLDRTVVGLAWESAWRDGRVRAEVAGKHYRYSTRGFTIQGQEFLPADPRRDVRNGVLAAASWLLLPAVNVKGSLELATRLPDVHEVLGDFATVRPNPLLKPESSTNANLGVHFDAGSIRAEVAGFLRNTDDIVFMRTSQFFSIHENLLKARTVGVEAAAEASPLPFLSARASGTWQDVRNRSPQGQSTSVAERYYNARLPNVPVLFGNGQLTVFKPGAGADMRGWWSVGYVREFFLHWEVDGRRDSKAMVPRQLAHNLGLAREFAAGRVRLNAELQNVFNARVYDVFSVPRPGRTFQISVRALLVSPAQSPAAPQIIESGGDPQ